MTKIPTKAELKRNLSSYLLELKQITGRDVDSKSLSSIEDVEELREKASVLANLDKVRFVINFSEKNSEQFKKFIENLGRSNSNSIYIWTNRANLYGLYKVASIDAIDFSFSFDVNPDGIIVFLTSDLSDKLLFDFSYDSEDREIIEVELQGKHWPFVPFEFGRPLLS